MAIKVLRKISPLFGQTYEAGQEIPDEVEAKMTQQSIQALVNRGLIDKPGFSPMGGAADAHFKARLDKLSDDNKRHASQIAVALQANDDLVKRLSDAEARLADLEGKAVKPAKGSRREQHGAAPPVTRET